MLSSTIQYIHFALLYHTLLYSAVLDYPMLLYSVLYCTVLCYSTVQNMLPCRIVWHFWRIHRIALVHYSIVWHGIVLFRNVPYLIAHYRNGIG